MTVFREEYTWHVVNDCAYRMFEYCCINKTIFTTQYNPVIIQHTDSSSDDNTTQQRIVKGYNSDTGKRYSFPPKQGNT